jgi:hypothetical protein
MLQNGAICYGLEGGGGVIFFSWLRRTRLSGTISPETDEVLTDWAARALFMHRVSASIEVCLHGICQQPEERTASSLQKSRCGHWLRCNAGDVVGSLTKRGYNPLVAQL